MVEEKNAWRSALLEESLWQKRVWLQVVSWEQRSVNPATFERSRKIMMGIFRFGIA